ncbi:MAG TPA: hypothetical protein VLI71_02355 [Gammaproteobacteria bacterium]|nr:hypothetical protein [Gammaproteobacteria bacterium]
MLFQRRFHERIVDGEIRCTVRIWQRPHVKVGGRYGLSRGAIVVDEIHETRLDNITPALARRCGFESRIDLLKVAKHGRGERVFVIDFHYDGKAAARPEPATGAVSAGELAELARRLDAIDRRSRVGPWTLATLRVIGARPGVLAARLASSLGRPRDEFKRDVRKLKNLGLTLSLEIGYRLTPKGEALVAAIDDAGSEAERT